MNDLSGRSERVLHVCGSCAQSLFGRVRHCPFCGTRQPDQVASDDTSAQGQKDTGTKPLTRFGERAEVARQSQAPSAAPVMAPPNLHPSAANAEQASDHQPKATPPQAASRTSAPVPSPTVGTPVQTGTSTAVASPQPSSTPSAPSGKFMWIVLFILAGAGYAGWEFLLKPKAPDLCQQALESAASSMQANQFAQARTQALGAVARCTGDSQERAKTVLKAAESAQAADDNCGKAMRLSDSQISEGRLKLASRTLDTQTGACLSREDATSRRQRIASSRASATEKLSQASTQVSEGKFDMARASVSEAERFDRDSADLSKIRQDIDSKAKEAARPAAPLVASPLVQAATVPSQVTGPASDRIAIVAFRADVNPREASIGQQVQITSTITTVGQSERATLIEVELELLNSQGIRWGQPSRKTVTSTNHGGEFTSSFTLSRRESWELGAYSGRLSLYVNGAPLNRTEKVQFEIIQGFNASGSPTARETTRPPAAGSPWEPATRSPREPATRPAMQPVDRETAKPPMDREIDSAETIKRVECTVLVRAGQRALSNKSYDEAMQSAREAEAAFGNCPGAQGLLQSARQAKDKARQSVTIQ